MSHENPNGQISGPSLGHLSPEGVRMDAFLRAKLTRRKEVANRPETIEAVALRRHAAEEQRLRKLSARRRGDAVYGPPDPTKGRAPMTR
jgi:hypothetical protein